MSLSFDFISDLYIEDWENQAIDWNNIATSPYCVIAGNVSADRKSLVSTLKKIGESYHAVFYIDGSLEHKNYLSDLDASYKNLSLSLRRLSNIVFLQNNVVVVHGVAFVATNGWWTFDFNSDIAKEQSVQWWQEQTQHDWQTSLSIMAQAQADAAYLAHTIEKLQKHYDVKQIVMLTNSVPDWSMVKHDPLISNTPLCNVIGNSLMLDCLALDHEKKLHTWCFGQYHGSVDTRLQGVRFVSNGRGEPTDPQSKFVYYPLRITVDN